MEYLQSTDPDAFVDFPAPNPVPEGKALCPKCKGHGGWNLRLHAYPLPAGRENTADHRHKFVHFRAGCSHCNGWGHCEPEDADHVHDWQYVKNLGNCYNLYECSICHKKQSVDSSD